MKGEAMRQWTMGLAKCRRALLKTGAMTFLPVIFFILTIHVPLTESGGAAKAETSLVLERSIPLPDAGGRIDHMAVDRGRAWERYRGGA
jgi:hypothetical protein